LKVLQFVPNNRSMSTTDRITFDAAGNSLPDFSRGEHGLLPAIAQDAANGRVLMLAWMNQEAFNESLRSGIATYYSRSRQKIWRKGETSGHEQRIRSIQIDCDADTILLLVDQAGAACHEGYRSCFFRELVGHEFVIGESQVVDPKTVYEK
jgi:phosphoribosyl-AMP cyclohydrolase